MISGSGLGSFLWIILGLTYGTFMQNKLNFTQSQNIVNYLTLSWISILMLIWLLKYSWLQLVVKGQVKPDACIFMRGKFLLSVHVVYSYSVPLEKHMFLFWKDTTIHYQGEPNLDYFTTLRQVTFFFLLIISNFFAIYTKIVILVFRSYSSLS